MWEEEGVLVGGRTGGGCTKSRGAVRLKIAWVLSWIGGQTRVGRTMMITMTTVAWVQKA